MACSAAWRNALESELACMRASAISAVSSPRAAIERLSTAATGTAQVRRQERTPGRRANGCPARLMETLVSRNGFIKVFLTFLIGLPRIVGRPTCGAEATGVMPADSRLQTHPCRLPRWHRLHRVSEFSLRGRSEAGSPDSGNRVCARVMQRVALTGRREGAYLWPVE